MSHFQILVISLPHSTQRREHVQSEFQSLQTPWQFIEAIDGVKLASVADMYNAKKVTQLLGFELTPAEIGCFLSHRKAWEECVKSNTVTIVFEDDFILKPHFQESVDLLLTQYIDWDIARLQGLREALHQKVKSFAQCEVVLNREDPLGATAYLLKPLAAKKLLECSAQIFEPLDHFIEHRKIHGLRIIALKPYPVVAHNLPTTITGRPARPPVSGFKKIARSFARWVDRRNNPYPWFPK